MDIKKRAFDQVSLSLSSFFDFDLDYSLINSIA